MNTRNTDVMTGLTSSEVELWLDDNVDWLCDYLQRHKSILAPTPESQSRHTVPTQCRHDESTPSVVRSTTHGTVPSSHHQRSIQRGVTMATIRGSEYLTSASLCIKTSESLERPPSSRSQFQTSDTTNTNIQTNSKRYTETHRERLRDSSRDTFRLTQRDTERQRDISRDTHRDSSRDSFRLTPRDIFGDISPGQGCE